MLSKNQIKLLTSLKLKKNRIKFGLFVVEGLKSVTEFNHSEFEVETLFYTTKFKNFLPKQNTQLITEKELKKISNLKNPSQVLGVFKIPKPVIKKKKGLIIALDAIKDPGNLGTIIRLCDWFGVNQLVCSLETVDCYNPKVIQATMGSLTRVSIVYVDLNKYLLNTKLTVFASLMQGKNIYQTKLPKQAILVMGNEANGISNRNLKLIKNKISIPKFGNLQTESLNVATATAILLSEFKR
ncbi:MAG: RNA methyltransferase [Flavobacteriaceae bacterium]|nr:RNA methyltransferase [Flavobacteriaceae bacterium]